MSDQHKYLKYKKKYLDLKNQIGGAPFSLKEIVECVSIGDCGTWEGVLHGTVGASGRPEATGDYRVADFRPGTQCFVASIHSFIDGTIRYDLVEFIYGSEIKIYFNIPEEALKKCDNPNPKFVEFIQYSTPETDPNLKSLLLHGYVRSAAAAAAAAIRSGNDPVAAGRAEADRLRAERAQRPAIISDIDPVARDAAFTRMKRAIGDEAKQAALANGGTEDEGNAAALAAVEAITNGRNPAAAGKAVADRLKAEREAVADRLKAEREETA